MSLVALGLLLLAGPAAQAETWQAPDAHRDVTTYGHSSEPSPCGTDQKGTDPTDRLRDVVRVQVDHDREEITVRVTMRELKRRSDTSWRLHLLVPTGAFVIDVHPGDKGEPYFLLMTKEPHIPANAGDGGCGFVTYAIVEQLCDALSASASPPRDVLVLSLPRECLRDPRWVKVGVDVSGGFTGNLDSFSIHGDEWTPPGVERSGFLPPYGPRVRHG